METFPEKGRSWQHGASRAHRRPARPERGGAVAATIKDVAASAGVGIATVSRVFSGTGAVSAATRERVLAAARDLHYRPSAVGRSLKTRRTGGLGLAVPDATDPFCADLIGGVLDCARTLGQHVLLDATLGDPAREAEIADRFAEQRVDGVIAVPSGTGDPWEGFPRAGVPLVFAGRVPSCRTWTGRAPAVLADDAAGIRSAVEYLVGLGHRRVGFLGAPAPGTPPDVREDAFRAALTALGVPVEEDLVARARPTRDSAYAAAAGLLQRRSDLTAVLASGHLPGEAAVLVARELDLRVPADLSIAMVDDVAWAELCDPPLTAVSRPARDLGYRACELAARGGVRRGPSGPVLLPTELVVRGSCGPAPSRRARH
ncbi:LacI family transcriptional regulator [Actinomadura logoneensis]|uniref:LacI family transcriptional regulator n=1 Tax=Actinomadura logoneensis TaxID=2293572 RepID=A0A372JAY8_9ACTN|nr:LacI family transcriptional regulator [Actinomadura logoneensis]